MTTTLVHLSDLHLETAESWKVLEALGTAIPGLQAQALIVSGDFLDHPNPLQLGKVRDALLKLCTVWGGCPLVVTPGNHDYKQFGLFRTKAANAEFQMVFGEWQKPQLLTGANGRKLAIFTFDSNTSDPRVNFARGRVGSDELNRFGKAHEEFEREPGFADAYKIAVLHHHPLPIADTEGGGHFQTDAYLGLEDAGLFLRKMAQRGIDLVLHGHKHASFLARVQIDLDERTSREVVVLAAGSACRRPGPCSFNVIEFNGATVHATVWESQAGTSFFASPPVPLLSYERFRERAYELYLREDAVDRSVELEAHHCLMLEYGDCDRSVERQNVRIKAGRPAVESWGVRKECEHGIYAGFAVKAISSGDAHPEFVEAGDSGDGKLLGSIRFAVPLQYEDRTPFSFEETYRIFNAFALTREQRQRMVGRAGDERMTVRVKQPIGTLLLCLQFPPGIPLPAIQAVVHPFGKPETPNLTERNWCQQHLHISRLTRTAILTVPKPLADHCYGLRWQLPSELPPDPSQVGIAGKADHWRRQLLRQQTRKELQPVFDDALGSLRTACKIRSDEHIELGLMVFDDARNRLRFVAGCIDPRFWEYEMVEGQGIVARSHKLGDALVYVRGAVQPRMDYSSNPPAGLCRPEILACVPLRCPIIGRPSCLVGVVALSSDSPASPLLSLYESAASMNAMTSYFTELFIDKLLPALGLES